MVKFLRFQCSVHPAFDRPDSWVPETPWERLVSVVVGLAIGWGIRHNTENPAQIFYNPLQQADLVESVPAGMARLRLKPMATL